MHGNLVKLTGRPLAPRPERSSSASATPADELMSQSRRPAAPRSAPRDGEAAEPKTTASFDFCQWLPAGLHALPGSSWRGHLTALRAHRIVELASISAGTSAPPGGWRGVAQDRRTQASRPAQRPPHATVV